MNTVQASLWRLEWVIAKRHSSTSFSVQFMSKDLLGHGIIPPLVCASADDCESMKGINVIHYCIRELDWSYRGSDDTESLEVFFADNPASDWTLDCEDAEVVSYYSQERDVDVQFYKFDPRGNLVLVTAWDKAED